MFATTGGVLGKMQDISCIIPNISQHFPAFPDIYRHVPTFELVINGKSTNILGGSKEMFIARMDEDKVYSFWIRPQRQDPVGWAPPAPPPDATGKIRWFND